MLWKYSVNITLAEILHHSVTEDVTLYQYRKHCWCIGNIVKYNYSGNIVNQYNCSAVQFFFTLEHCTNVAVIIWYQQKYRYTSSLQRKYCYRKSHEGDLTVLLRREAARESHAVIRADVYFTNYVSVSHTGYRAHYLPICLWNDVKTWDPNFR